MVRVCSTIFLTNDMKRHNTITKKLLYHLNSNCFKKCHVEVILSRQKQHKTMLYYLVLDFYMKNDNKPEFLLVNLLKLLIKQHKMINLLSEMINLLYEIINLSSEMIDFYTK